MFADEAVDHLRVLFALALLGAVRPVLDRGLDLSLAGDGQFVDLLDGHRVSGCDRHVVFEQDLVGDVGEAADAEAAAETDEAAESGEAVVEEEVVEEAAADFEAEDVEVPGGDEEDIAEEFEELDEEVEQEADELMDEMDEADEEADADDDDGGDA